MATVLGFLSRERGGGACSRVGSHRRWHRRLDRIESSAYNAIIDCNASDMASITIRNFDEHTKARLRLRAARHKRSMEEEARNILRTVLSSAEVTPGNLAEAIRRRFEPLGGVQLELPTREPMREPPKPGK